MTGTSPGTIGFLGLGLVGGSIARALASGSWLAPGDRPPRCVAWSPSGDGPARALAAGVIDGVARAPAEALRGADLVVIATPPLETVGLIERLGTDLAGSLAPGALVTDVTSTKERVMAAAAQAGIAFVGGHPMAGRETSGYGASVADLFAGRPWVIVVPPGADASTAGPVRWLARACGATPVEMSAAEHDVAVAAISHLPLVVAAALVEAVAGRAAPDYAAAMALAASGWAGMTRLARGDATMGAGIVATNAPAIAADLRRLRQVLDGWIEDLEAAGGPEPAAIRTRLARARAALPEVAEPTRDDDTRGEPADPGPDGRP
jgi:prephenate dehydrogenase